MLFARRLMIVFAIAPALLVAGCAPQAASPTVEVTAPPMPPPPTETPAPEPTPTAAGPAFETMTYRDEVAGFAFDYPAGWVVGPIEQYARGGITAFTSWQRPADVLPDEAPAGETRMDATVQLWDPQGDLPAFIEQRRTAWDASGIEILSEAEWALSDGRPAQAFVISAVDGAQAYFFLTTLGDKYLVLSGSGDLALLEAIARTVRPLSP